MALYAINIILECPLYIEADSQDVAIHEYDNLSYEDIQSRLKNGTISMVSGHEVITDFYA